MSALEMNFSEGFEVLPTNGAGSQMNLLKGCLAKLLVKCKIPEEKDDDPKVDPEGEVSVEEGKSPVVGLVLALILVGLIFARTKGTVKTPLLLLFGYVVLSAGGSFLYYSS